MADFWQLGLDPIAVSAISGTGTGDLMEQLVALLPPPKTSEAIDSSDKALAVAIIGRPNVGKSSILNSLVSPACDPVSFFFMNACKLGWCYTWHYIPWRCNKR